ncbi:hypothetical protein EPUL_004486, partial [Erysiphe pulchra]
MAPPARDKKRGVSETLDPKRRVQKNVNNSGRAQQLAATLTRSVAKSTVVAERIAVVQDTQVVASPPAQLPVPSMDLDDEMETEGLLDLVGPYLEEMETQFPGAGSGFLALITDGVSRA